jgi:carbonic anhydrase
MMKKIVLTLVMLLFSAQVWASTIPNVPTDIAFQMLKKGNYRFYSYTMKHPNQSKIRRDKLITGQHPFAIIVTCSDSRVAPELLFDQGLGDIFVIRNAGNVLDEHVMGSIEYGVEHLGINLVVVMGHESCGAVGAAMKEDKESPAIESIIESIKPAIDACKKDNSYSYENVIKEHARQAVDSILEDKGLSEYMKKHDVKVVPAFYCLQTGQVEFLK